MNAQPSNYSNMWWAIDSVLAGMAIPQISTERRYGSPEGMTVLEDDLTLIYRTGIRAVVSLLNHPGDEKIFQSAGFEFKCFPVIDGHPPSMFQAQQFISFVNSCRSKKLPVLVFCIGGIGRTGTMIACYMIDIGMSADDAVAYVRTKEPMAIETASQLAFLHDFEKLTREH